MVDNNSAWLVVEIGVRVSVMHFGSISLRKFPTVFDPFAVRKTLSC